MTLSVQFLRKARLTFSISLLLLSSSGICQDIEFDIKQGAKAAKQIADSYAIDTVSIAAKYLSDVGYRLTRNLENQLFDYKFHLIDMSEPNAFALPGGYVYVTRGIITLLNNEDELAGIIGHEIIHAQNRHSYKASKKKVLPTILKAPGNVVGLVNEDLGNLINAPVNISSALGLAKYGRKQEEEADAYGVRLAAKSGYRPAALATALENLSKDIEYLTGSKEKFSYFNDHPFTPERVENIRGISKNLSVASQVPIASIKNGFLDKLSGIYIGKHPRQGVFDRNRFYHLDLDLDITFPPEWPLINSSTYVAARQPKGAAMIYMIVLPGKLEPKEYGKAFITRFRKKYRVESYRAEDLQINGYPAYIFGIDEMSNGQKNNSTLIWIKKDSITYQIVGAGLKKYEKDFESVAGSITTLTEQTKARVTGIVLSIAEAKEGESLEELSTRTGNVLSLEYLTLINGIQPGIALEGGQLLKTGIKKQYLPGE